MVQKLTRRDTYTPHGTPQAVGICDTVIKQGCEVGPVLPSLKTLDNNSDVDLLVSYGSRAELESTCRKNHTPFQFIAWIELANKDSNSSPTCSFRAEEGVSLEVLDEDKERIQLIVFFHSELSQTKLNEMLEWYDYMEMTDDELNKYY